MVAGGRRCWQKDEGQGGKCIFRHVHVGEGQSGWMRAKAVEPPPGGRLVPREGATLGPSVGFQGFYEGPGGEECPAHKNPPPVGVSSPVATTES